MDVIPLPPRPNLEQYRKRAKDLVKAWKSSDADAVRAWASEWLNAIIRLSPEPPSEFVLNSMERAVDRFAEYLHWKKSDQGSASLADAQFVIARAHGFESWAVFVSHVESIPNASTETSVFESAADAVVGGDINTLHALLSAHPQLVHEKSTRSHAATLLHYVAANGVEDFRQKSPKNAVAIATLLLDAGAKVDAIADTYGKDNYQTTMNLLVSSVHPAAAGVQVPLVHLLLDRGAAVNGLDDDSSPLITAISFWYPKAAEALVERGARMDQVTTAAAMGRLDIVQQLVIDPETLAPGTPMNLVWKRMPADPKAHIEVAAVWAAMYDRRDVVSWLLDIGVSPTAMDTNHMSLLHYAAAKGNLPLVDRLIDAGADLELTNSWGGTVLDSTMYFARNDPTPGVDYALVARHLLDRGADARAVSPFPTGIAGIDEVLSGPRANPRT
jgi:ankyrin repeat protein